MIKILYVNTLNLGVAYWRIENYAEQMVRMKASATVNVEYFDDILPLHVSWPSMCVGYGEISDKIQRKLRSAFKFFDIIIFQRFHSLAAIALIEEFKKEFPKVKTVAEIDDSLGEVSPSSPYNWTDQHRWSAEHLYRSDAVICSTEYLAKSIRPVLTSGTPLHVGDKPLHIAPNCINRGTWKVDKKKLSHDGIRIGYVGGGAHDDDLRIAYRALLPLLDKNIHVKFIIRYGGYRPSFLKKHPQIDFKSVNWNMTEYPQQLYDMDLDLALAPLCDSEFNRCKSNLKWIEWSSLDVPLLASDVEPYRKTKGGIWLVDNSIKSWRNAFTEFISDNDLGIGGGLKSHLETKSQPNKSKMKLSKQCITYYSLHTETRKLLYFLKSLL